MTNSVGEDTPDPPVSPSARTPSRRLTHLRLSPFLAIFVAVLFVPIAWLIAWYVVSHVAAVRPSATPDDAAVLATVGGIMGALFTVGGLVIALVAVLSQISLQERAEQFMQQKFDDLVPRFEERISNLITARFLMEEATNALTRREWLEAKRLTERAVSHYPQLPLAWSTLALTWYNQFMTTNYLQSIRGGHLRSDDARQEASDIVELLDLAEKAHDDPHGQVSAARGVMYGYFATYKPMMREIRKAITADPSRRADLLKPAQLSVLAGACGTNMQRLDGLHDVLNVDLPVRHETVISALSQADMRSGHATMTWIAIAKPGHAQRGIEGNTVVEVEVQMDTAPAGSGARIVVQARIKAPGVGQITVQPSGIAPKPIDALIAQLDQELMIICSA